MYCIEESTGNIVGTFRRPPVLMRLGRCTPLPPRYAPVCQISVLCHHTCALDSISNEAVFFAFDTVARQKSYWSDGQLSCNCGQLSRAKSTIVSHWILIRCTDLFLPCCLLSQYFFKLSENDWKIPNSAEFMPIAHGLLNFLMWRTIPIIFRQMNLFQLTRFIAFAFGGSGLLSFDARRINGQKGFQVKPVIAWLC